MPGFASTGLAVLAFTVCAAAGLSEDQSSASLPDARPFLEEVRQNLKSDELLLDQYTFTEVFRESRLDSHGGVKKSKVEIYEVYPSNLPGKTYRRLVVRDGAKLSEAQLAEQDRKQEEKSDKKERRLAAEDAAARRVREEQEKRQEREVIDEVFRMDEIAVAGRELVNGRPTIVVTFSPRPGFRPVTAGAKVVQKLAGRAWIDEADRQLARLEATLVDSMAVGPAKLARLQKGATAFFQRTKINGEIWLPIEARFTGTAKAFFLFGARVDVHSTYGDYKKFSVGTEEEIKSSD
ncbi:MAG: hypothetical protein ABI968_02015 [Acidobacteriota bacterium]